MNHIIKLQSTKLTSFTKFNAMEEDLFHGIKGLIIMKMNYLEDSEILDRSASLPLP